MKGFTIACLTLITIVELISTGGMVSVLLWIGYGFYKLDRSDN
jgi:hypothetical protein